MYYIELGIFLKNILISNVGTEVACILVYNIEMHRALIRNARLVETIKHHNTHGGLP